VKHSHYHHYVSPITTDPYAGINGVKAFAISMGLGIGIGIAVALLLRETKLRWSWTLLGALLVPIVGQIDWRLGVAYANAVLWASGLGYWLHKQEKERGGPEAREEEQRLGPLRWARSLISRAKQSDERVVGDKLAIGTNRRGERCWVPFGRDHGVHGLVLGATGSGKTVTQAAIAVAYILAGLPVIVLDPKGDRYLRAVLRDAAARAGARFLEWSPTGSYVYNPFGRGGPTEIADKALAGHDWSEPHYKLITERLLGQVMTTMRAAGEWPPTLSKVVRYMDPERLDALASQVGGDVAERVSAYVDSLSPRAKAELGGGRDRLAVLAESELGPRLDPALGDGPPLSFEETLGRGDVLYMTTDADRYPAASKLLGAAVVIDLVTLTADLQDGELRGLLLVDEFSAVLAEDVSRIFGRARGAGLSVLLGTQSLADIRSARPDDPTDTLTEQLSDNIEFAIVHRQNDPASAERLAQMAGTKAAYSTTRRVGGVGALSGLGDGTRTPGREFLVHPDEFKRLRVGEAVVINPMAKTPAEIVRIWPPKEAH
jgi:conjugal transfer pilus assembly protein TraD